tara:strand:+ start:1614 stop:2177 length:564 start_codon:yes stop_codon:yes gene_type:complete
MSTENTGIKYKDFKSEEYVEGVDLLHSLVELFVGPFKTKEKKAHDNINEIIESLPDDKIERIARIGHSPAPFGSSSYGGNFTDIYRILNPDSTINIQAIPGQTGDTSMLGREEKRELASGISWEGLMKQLEENPNKASMTKNELARVFGQGFPRTYLSEEFYLNENPRTGYFVNGHPVKKKKYPFGP